MKKIIVLWRLFPYNHLHQIERYNNPRKFQHTRGAHPKQSRQAHYERKSLYSLSVKVARGVFQRCVETTSETINPPAVGFQGAVVAVVVGTVAPLVVGHTAAWPWVGKGLFAPKNHRRTAPKRLNESSSKPMHFWLVVEPTHLKNMLVKMEIFPK